MIRFTYKKIGKKDILLLDKNYAKLSFNDISYDIANLNEINIFCITKILKNFFRYFLKYSLRDIYLKSLVEIHSPKMVISHNLEGYSYRIKYLCEKIFCVTYQHSFFYEVEKEFYKKNFGGKSCDLFITYHSDDTKFLSQLIKSRFISLGSVKNNEIVLKKNNEKNIPLLLISEYRKNPSKLHLDKQIKLCQYIREFSKNRNIVPHVALSSNREDKNKYNFLEEELNFFKKYLKDFNWKKENSFISASKSNLIICLSSNMGIEILSRGYKIVFFNLIGDEDKLQVNPYLIKKRPNYFFSNLDDKETIKKLNYYFDLNLKQWEKESDFLNNSVLFDENNVLFKKEIKKIITSDEKN